MITINRRERIEWTPGTTVQDVLERMNNVHLSRGEKGVVIRVDGEVVMDYEAYDSYAAIPDEDRCAQVIHLMAGG